MCYISPTYSTVNLWQYMAWLALPVLMGTGCCHLPCAHSAAHQKNAPASLRVAYDQVKVTDFVCEAKPQSPKPGCTVQRLELTSAAPSAPGQTNHPLVLDYFLPCGPGKHPVLVILPMLGGSYPIEKYFAAYFGKRGFASIIVHREKIRREAECEAIDALLRQSVLDNRLAIDWIETRPELDAQRIGVFGISMGGIKGALLTPLEPRVRAATLGLAGGDLPYVLTYSTEHGIAKKREELLRQEHMTLSELHEKLKECVHCDPNTVAGLVDPKKVLLILGACDTVVPINKGLELRRKMGKPETIVVPSGHYSAILFVPYIEHQCYKFFKKKLDLPAGHRPRLEEAKRAGLSR